MTERPRFEGNRRKPTHRATREELREQRASLARQQDVLPAVRAQAEKWAAVVTGLIGGAGIAALLGGPSNFTKLAGPWDIIASSIFFIGAALSVGSLLLASWAAQMRFTKGLISGRLQRRHDEDATDRAIAQLNDARQASTIGVGVVLLSALVLWAAPQETSKTSLQGTSADGEVICGELDRVRDVPLVKGDTRRYRLDELRDVTARQAC